MASKLQVQSHLASSLRAQKNYIAFRANFKLVDATILSDVDIVAYVLQPKNSKDMRSSCPWSSSATDQTDVEIKAAWLLYVGQLLTNSFFKMLLDAFFDMFCMSSSYFFGILCFLSKQKQLKSLPLFTSTSA